MPSQEDIANQQELLAAHRRTLAEYLKQQALISELYTPPSIVHGIDDARADIRRVKDILRGWSVPVEDHPDDEETTAQPPIEAPEPRAPRRRLATRRLALLALALVVFGAAGALAAFLLRRSPTPSTVLKSDITWSQCDGVSVPRVLPGTIAPAQDPDKARQQLAQAIAEEQIDTWLVAGPDVEALASDNQAGDPRKFYMTMSGTGEGKVNIHLFNTASVIVTTQKSAEHIDVATFTSMNILDRPSGCGGGTNREFPLTDLTQDSKQYTRERVYSNHPFLMLSSEASEVLMFPFECRSPGIYTIQIAFAYRDNIASTSNTYLSSELPTIVCPSSFTYWSVMYLPDKSGSNKPDVQLGVSKQYFWNGARYQEGRKP
jgi:hypothetical protein